MKAWALLAAGGLPWVVIILIIIALGGCATPPPAPVMTKTLVERVTIPAGLLSCAPAPVIAAYTRQSQVADYLVRLEEAGADCRDTVSSIAAIEAAPAPAPTTASDSQAAK